MNLSQHFTLREATASQKGERLGLDNNPSAAHLQNMKYTAAQMEKVRMVLGDNPIRINSWYRSLDVNRAVGGVPTSQHASGEAVDFTCATFGTAKEVALVLQSFKKELEYDQLIYEQTWVHISFVSERKPRGSDLTYMGNGKYIKGIQ